MELNTKLEEIFKNKKFSENIYYDIFKIFKESGENYSNNSNGVFINLNDCKQETVLKVYDYIENIQKINLEHESYLKKTEQTIDDFKKILKDDDKKPIKKQYYRKSRKVTDAESKILDKELVLEKPVYKGVYKRIYNSMKGYKNKPTVKKDDDKCPEIEYVEDVDVEDVIDDVVDDVVDEIEFEDLADELFGSDSDCEKEPIKK